MSTGFSFISRFLMGLLIIERNARFQAEAATDEVYAQVSLFPESEVGVLLC